MSTFNDTHADPHRIVVIGAGYAGVLAANRILSSLHRDRRSASLPSCSVTVINPRADFVERIRLHEVAAGSRDTASTPLQDVLHPDATLIVGSAMQIDPDDRVVEVLTDAGIQPVEYDTLIYAVGSTSAHAIAGVDDHTYRVGEVDSAQALQSALAALPAHARVRVVGGGLTAVETASEIASRHGDLEVQIVCAGTVLSSMPSKARRKIETKLTLLGVSRLENAAVTAVREREIVTERGELLAFDVCVWAASFAVPDLAYRSGLATDPAGRLRVDSTLTSIDYPDIIGAGDATIAPAEVGGHLRMGCATALPLGAHAAATVLARLRGESPTALSIGFVAQCISLGRKAGVIQFVHADDSPRSLVLSGRVGSKVKESICRMTLSSLIKEQSRPGAYKSPKGPNKSYEPIRSITTT